MKKAKVLIIESETIVAHDLADMLGEWGYEVVGMFFTGDEAHEKAREVHPDLALVDITVTGPMDAIEAADRIRKDWDTAIIYLTTHRESALFERAIETHPYGYLIKPFTEIELHRTIKMALDRRQMEKQLRASEEKYAKAFQFSEIPMAVSTIDDGVFVEVNDAFVSATGFERHELLGKSSLDLGLWPDPSQRDQIMRELEEKGSIREKEVAKRTKDGSLLLGLYSATTIRLLDGPYLLASLEDITTLKEAEERFKIGAQIATDLIYEWDTSDDTLEWFGDIDGALGYDPGEFKRDIDSWIKSIHPDDLPRLLTAVDMHRRSLEPIAYEYRIRRKDGSWRHWSDRARPVLHESGLPSKWVGVCTDITEKKLSEVALKESEEKFRTIFEAATDGIFGIDAHTNKGLLASPSMCSLTGYSEPQMLELKLNDLHREEDLPFVLNQFEKLLERKIKVAREIPVLRKDGTVVYCDIAAGFSRYGDQEMVFGFFRDVTDRRDTEAALSSERLRFRELARNSPFGIVVIGDEGTFQYINPKFIDMFGYESSQIPSGKEWFAKAFPDPAYRHKVTEAWFEDAGKSEREDVSPRVFTVTSGYGTERVVSFRLVQLDTGEHVMTCEDITERLKAEEALKDSEERYRQMAENSLMGVFIQESGYFSYVNNRLAGILGCEPREMIGKHIFEFVHPDDRQLVYSKRVRRNDGPGVFTQYEFRAMSKGGGFKWLELYASRIQYQGRSVIMGNAIDITQRKRAEDAFRESEERFRTAFQTSPDSININRVDDGLYVDVNEGFTAITGYTRQEVVGKSWLDIDIWNDPKDRERLAERLNSEGYVKNLEAKFRFKGGRVRTGLMSAKVISLDGEPHILAVTRDIEEWKKTQDALRESERRLELALTGADLGLWDWDLRAGKAVLSEGAYKILGYRPGEMAPDVRSWKRSVHPNDWEHVSEVLNSHLSGKSPTLAVQYRNMTKSGQWKWVSARGKIVQRDEDGTPIRMSGTVQDITESKRLQEQLLRSQKLEAVGTLAGGIAHDVNNLLQVILGQADLLIHKKAVNEQSEKSVEAIRRAALNGSDLVKRVLMFSRKAEPEMTPLNLTHEVRRVRELLRRTIPKMISIEMILDQELEIVSGDPSQLEQVLVNLAINAADAMPDGGKLVFETKNTTLDEEYCRVHPEVTPGNYVQLSVSDTGEGMEKHVLDRVYEPFFSTKHPAQGTGLGLSIVFGIVKSHKGYINCYSEPNVGTTFQMHFPVAKGEVPAAVSDTVEMPAGGTDLLLLVDDEEAVRSLGSEMLEMAGYRVLTAANGREALEVYTEHRESISMVILDLVMPEMSGGQCLERLLAMDPNVKVLIASGYSSEGYTKDLVKSGATAFISKPFNMKQFLTAVRRCLDSSRDPS